MACPRLFRASLLMSIGWVAMAVAPASRPLLFFFLPRHGAPGTRVTVYGTGLEQVKAVAVGKANAPFQVLDDRRLLLVVPDDAATGPIVVATAAGTFRAPGAFTVDPVPAPLAGGPPVPGPGRSAAAPGPEAPVAGVPCLLVSGRCRQGRWTLAPAYTLLALPAMPTGGEAVLELTDAHGATLRSFPFTPAEVADLPGGETQFSFALPLDGATTRRLAGLRIRAGGAVAAARQGGWQAAPRPPKAVSLGAGRVHLTWNGEVGVGVMVRDPATGQVLAFGEGGSATFQAPGRELEVHVSNGVTSQPFRVTVD